ncbi:unnamed protein product [Onchocerca flexuosa]|uniref:Exosporium leader peptide n=1 Tax=Onchocerca flexuosa TaxID=387005 RepID=A0A183HZB6_9BILA|nr:unnamed protein product [Onchocerca flexuosa]
MEGQKSSDPIFSNSTNQITQNPIEPKSILLDETISIDKSTNRITSGLFNFQLVTIGTESTGTATENLSYPGNTGKLL